MFDGNKNWAKDSTSVHIVRFSDICVRSISSKNHIIYYSLEVKSKYAILNVLD